MSEDGQITKILGISEKRFNDLVKQFRKLHDVNISTHLERLLKICSDKKANEVFALGYCAGRMIEANEATIRREALIREATKDYIG